MSRPDVTPSERALRRDRYLAFKIKGRKYRFDLVRELQLAKTVEDTAMYHAERYLFWAKQSARFDLDVRRLESELSATKNAIKMALRDQQRAGAESLQGRTDRELDYIVNSQDEVGRVVARLNIARYRAEVCGSMAKAFEHRRQAFTMVFARKRRDA